MSLDRLSLPLIIVAFLALSLPSDVAQAIFAEAGYVLMNGTCSKSGTQNSSSSSKACENATRLPNQITVVQGDVEEIENGAYLAGLAKERKETLDCAGEQLASLDRNAIELNQFVETYAENLTALAKAKMRMATYAAAAGRDSAAAAEYKKAKAEANLYLSNLPFSEIKSVKLMINQIVSQQDLFVGKGPEDWFQQQMKEQIRTALKKGASDLAHDKEVLNQGVKSGGVSLGLSMRESLAQDTQLIETYRMKNKDKEAALKGVACRVDASYGKGAQYRDNALLALAVLGSAGTLGVGAGAGAAVGASAGAGLMSSITGVVAGGSLAARAGAMLRVLAAVGQSAGTLMQIESACHGDRVTLSAQGGANGKRCEPNALKSLENDTCFMVAGLNAIGAAPAAGKMAMKVWSWLGSKMGRAAVAAERSVATTAEVATQAAKSATTANVAKSAVTTGEREAKRLSKTDQLLQKYGLTRQDLAAEKAAVTRGASLSVTKSLVTKNAALDRAGRIKRIQEDFPHLKAEQVVCLVDQVHSIGAGKGVYKYSPQEIAQKAIKSRRACGVTSIEDIDALIRLGYTGDNPLAHFAMDPKAASDFERLLGGTTKSPSVRSFDNIEQAIAREKDPLKKAALEQEKWKVVEQEVMADNGSLASTLITRDKEVQLVDYAAQASNKPRVKEIALSEEKVQQLIAKGTPLHRLTDLDLKPGHEVGIKSYSFGEAMGVIKRVDPDNPKNLFVEFRDANNQLRTVSIPQTELAFTPEEREKILLDLSRSVSGKSEIEKLLRKEGGRSAAEVVEELAKQAATSPQRVRAMELEDQMAAMSTRPELTVSPQYLKLQEEYRRLTSMDYDDALVIRAVQYINPNDLSQTEQSLKLLDQAEAVQQKYMRSKIADSNRLLLEQTDIRAWRQQVLTAKERINSADTHALFQINGTRSFGQISGLPSRQALNSTGGIRNWSLADYQKMERLFKADPRQKLDDDLSIWLRVNGENYIKDLNRPEVQDPKIRDVRRRLEIYQRMDRRN